MLCFQVDMDDIFNSAEHFVFPELCDNASHILPTLTDIDVPVNTETKKEKSVSKNKIHSGFFLLLQKFPVICHYVWTH